MKRWVLAAALVGCGLPEPEAAWEGEHVRLAADPGLVPCGDLVGHMDAYVTMICAEFGRPPPVAPNLIDFFWLEPEGFAERTICVTSDACAWARKVYAIFAPADHELVHALTWGYGTPPPFFIEGLAVAYEVPEPGDLLDVFSLAQLLEIEGVTVQSVMTSREGGWLPSKYYQLAGAFVSFLIERHGLQRVLRVYGELRLLDGTSRISRVFDEHFGESLDAAAAAFEASLGGCSARAFRLKRFECSAPEIAWDGARLAEFRTLDCDQDDVVGPYSTEVLALYRTLAVEVGGAYEVTVLGDAGAGSGGRWNKVELVRCGGCEGYVEATLDEGMGTQLLELPAGRYSLRTLGPAGEASGVGLRIDRVWPPAGG